MNDFRVLTDVDECRRTWQRAFPADRITDLWDVRDCFHQHFGNRPHFLVSETADGVTDLLPLCWIEEFGYYGYFPGETWQGKTWLEQNRIRHREGALAALLGACPQPSSIRYLLPVSCSSVTPLPVDEIGYIFEPPRYAFDFENYLREFSSKSRNRLRRDIARLQSLGVQYRHDEPSDFEHIVALSLGRFGQDSYFHDRRFLESFRSLMRYLQTNGLLRMTTVLIDGTPAAVDMGCIYNGTYTLLAGGTHAAFPGVAKLINLHHMEYACEQRLAAVDFLCGDFSWKKLFHLTPRPLYLLSSAQNAAIPKAPEAESMAIVE